MGKYRKKPVVIEAIQWTENNLQEVIDFCGGLHVSARKWKWEEFEEIVRNEGLKIFTLEGSLKAAIGDYIIRGVKGENYLCPEDIFKETYEEVK